AVPCASTTRRLVELALEREGLRYHVALEAGGWSIIKRYVVLGFGIAVVPAFCIEPQDRGSLRTQSVSHLFGQDRYGLLTRRGEPARTGTRALIELLGRGP